MQTTRATRTAPRLVAVAAFALCAANAAHAVDWTGYFRGGPAATNAPNKSRQCYGIGPFKYRLGNECDFYGEFQLSQSMKADGVDFNAVLMTDDYANSTETNNNFGIAQAYVEMKGLDIAPQALFWMGRRRDRDDVHIVDTFFTNMTGVGAGVENLDAGYGKFGIAAYKSDTTPNVDSSNGETIRSTSAGGTGRIHFQWYDLPVNPDGKLRLIATFSKGDNQGPKNGQSGYGFTAEHVQSNFYGGNNHIWLSYAEGSTDLSQGNGDGAVNYSQVGSGHKAWRIVDSPSWQIGGFGGQAIAIYQHNKFGPADGPESSNFWSVGGRGSFAITNNLKWLTELGYENLKPEGGKNETVTKLTLGPALSTGPGFWKRPELRLYATFADYNKAAAADTANNYGFNSNKTSAVSYGAQVEIWW